MCSGEDSFIQAFGCKDFPHGMPIIDEFGVPITHSSTIHATVRVGVEIVLYHFCIFNTESVLELLHNHT